jgi:hypothetical protein
MAIVAGIVALAALAVILSSRANTSNVLGVSFQGLSSLLGTAIKPITG